MKKFFGGFACLVLCLGIVSQTWAVDLKASGLWQFGFGVGIDTLADKASGKHLHSGISNDKFKARQRIRQFFDAVVSESLSGTVGFEIGHIRWGQASTGGALGADGKIVKLRQAYIDWMVPESPVKVRMGIQNVTLPSVAGDSNIMSDTEVAAITAAWDITENVGLTAMWARPYNDNYDGKQRDYLDNIDAFMLSLPLRFEDAEITPWVMYGTQGKNAFREPNGHGGYNYVFQGNDAGNQVGSLGAIPFGNVNQQRGASPAYGSLFWFGLPVKYSPDPWNFEFEFDYGYAESMGRYSVEKSWYGTPYATQRVRTQREGWLAKALVEYKLDWMTSGIFGWYATGDDGNLKNGSRRIPFFYAETRLTSILGDDTCLYGGIGGNDRSLSFDGTWGLGLRFKDISFIPRVKHLLRATYIQGTNSPDMVKYAAYLSRGVYDPSLAWQGVSGTLDYYLTTRDHLLEFNFHNVVDIYENLKMGVEFSYVVNGLDKSLWKQAGNTTFSKSDMWVADVVFNYSF